MSDDSIRDAYDREVARQRDEVATGRRETEPCERGTIGCSVRHASDSECETW